MFKELHKAFEKNDTDLYEMQKMEKFSRYLLIRSLDSSHLEELIEENIGRKGTSAKRDLYEELFNSNVQEERIIEYIKKQYPAIRKERLEQEIYLPNIIKNFGEVRCGIRNDNLNDLTKELVRDKTIETKADLDKKISDLLKNVISGYISWQYYNQVTNDLIEHFFNDHEFVIPTLRKIKYVDFMVQIDGKIIPFDLKVTHISDDYFDLFQKGLISSDFATDGDDYAIGDQDSEIELIKEHYKSIKKKLELPNYGGLKKIELIEILRQSGHQPTLDFIKKIEDNRAEMVAKIEKELHSLEWWNYKYQGERLFKNNNRFFVFLAYKSSFEDARPLKGNLVEIGKKVRVALNELSQGKFNTTHYHYTKDRGLAGKYEVNSASVLVCD